MFAGRVGELVCGANQQPDRIDAGHASKEPTRVLVAAPNDAIAADKALELRRMVHSSSALLDVLLVREPLARTPAADRVGGQAMTVQAGWLCGWATGGQMACRDDALIDAALARPIGRLLADSFTIAVRSPARMGCCGLAGG